jgi:hypothetical protein
MQQQTQQVLSLHVSLLRAATAAVQSPVFLLLLPCFHSTSMAQ